MFKYLLTLMLIVAPACTTIEQHSNYLKSSTLFQDEKFARAYFYAKKATDKAPDNVKYAIMMAWICLKYGLTEKASEIIQAFEKESQTDIQFMQVAAWAIFSQGDDQNAQHWFLKALDWVSQHPSTYPEVKQYHESIQSDAYYGLGMIHARNNQFDQAREAFQEALSYENQFIGHQPIHIAYADTFYQNKEYTEAQEAFEKIVIDSPHSTIDTRIAWCHYYREKYHDAEIHLLKNLHESQDKKPFLYALIFSTFKQNKLKQAKKYLDTLIELDPAYADSHHIWQITPLIDRTKEIPLAFANQYYKKGHFIRAGKISQNELKKTPDNCMAQKIDIWCELYQGHAMLALSQFNQLAMDDACDIEMGTLGQGIALMYLGYFSDAKTFLNRIPEYSLHYVRAQMALGVIAYLTGDFEKAISIYEPKASELIESTDHFWPYLNLNTLGWAYIYSEQYQKAEEVLTQLNELENHLSGLHLFGLAWTKYQLGKKEDAVSILLDYQLTPKSMLKESLLLATAFYLDEDYDNAIAMYEKSIDDLPEKELFFSWGSYAIQNLGWCYIYTNQYEKALKTFLKLESYHPAPIYFVIYENLGWGYYYMGNMDLAEKSFKQSLKMAPTSQMTRDSLKKIQIYRSRSKI